jgi:hypothetical protein
MSTGPYLVSETVQYRQSPEPRQQMYRSVIGDQQLIELKMLEMINV